MRGLIKFLITVLVVVLIGYIVCHFVMNNENNFDDNQSENIMSGEIVDIYSGENPNVNSDEFMEENEQSPEIISGEIFNNISGENDSQELSGNYYEESKNAIDFQIANINSQEIINTFSDSLSSDMLSDLDKEFLVSFGQNELPVTINIKENFVEIIPTSDFLENKIYYYNEVGELIYYESISNTIAGSVKYYFKNNENIYIMDNYEEVNENLKMEDASQILNRAVNIYNKYLK